VSEDPHPTLEWSKNANGRLHAVTKHGAVRAEIYVGPADDAQKNGRWTFFVECILPSGRSLARVGSAAHETAAKTAAIAAAEALFAEDPGS
jgi:hypothetical protein